MAEIPLFRNGSEVATSVVDDADREDLLLHRWFLNSNGYAARTTWKKGCGRAFMMHREILGLDHGDGHQVDHVNRDKLDNRRANLRVVGYPEQAQNRPSHRGSTSQFRGVHWAKHKGLWRVRPAVNGTKTHVGYFASEIEAAEAAEKWRQVNMPFAEPDPHLSRALACSKPRPYGASIGELHRPIPDSPTLTT